MHDIFFFTDIHGMYDLYRAIMDYCNKQDPEAMIIFGGDACDRGPDGYKIMKELLDNPYVVYLKGNHEDMFCKAAREIKEMFGFENPVRENVEKILKAARSFDWRYAAIQDTLNNGGLKTLTDWVMDGMSMDFVNHIEHLPLTFSYECCDFCHSAGLYKTFKEVADAEYDNTKVDEYSAESLLWSRSTLNYDWVPERIAVFGHTPTPYLSDYIKFIPEKDWEISPVMFNKHTPKAWKLDMDTGAVFTGRAYVLNVLTLKAQGFEDKDINEKEINKHNIEKIDVIQF